MATVPQGAFVEETLHKRQGIVWNALGSVMFAANTFVMVVVVSRTASVATVGCFGIALAIAQLLFNVGLFGVDLFQMTDYQKRYRFADYRWTRLFSCLAMALVCALIVVFGMPEFEKKLFTGLLVAIFLVHAFADLYQGLLFRENRLDLFGQAVFFRVLLMLVAFVLVQMLTREVALALGASLVANILGAWLWASRRAKPYHDGRWDMRSDQVSSILRSCLPLFASSFLMLFIFNASRYGIDWFMDNETQGYFSMIVLPALAINLAGQFIFRPALRDIARLLEAADRRGFLHTLARQAFIVVVLTALAALAMLLFGIPLLTALYAVDLAGLAAPSALLVVGGGLFALNQLLYSVLVIMRRQMGILLVYGAGALIALLLAAGLIINFGLWGACLAFTLSQLPILVLFSLTIARELTSVKGRI
jgi:O-antigen/teichoic acid export membrane protein